MCFYYSKLLFKRVMTRISHAIPLQIWHNYELSFEGNTSFSGTRNFEIQISTFILVFLAMILAMIEN